MLIIFFDSKGIIHEEFAPSGQTVTGDYYFEVLKRLMARIPNIEIQKVGRCCTITRHLIIHSLFVNFWPEIKSVLNHLPYSLNLTPCDFFLFPKLKLKGFKIERMLFRRHSDHLNSFNTDTRGNITK